MHQNQSTSDRCVCACFLLLPLVNGQQQGQNSGEARSVSQHVFFTPFPKLTKGRNTRQIIQNPSDVWSAAAGSGVKAVKLV